MDKQWLKFLGFPYPHEHYFACYVGNIIKTMFRALIHPKQSILHIGCKDGYLLKALSPQRGVGIETHPEWVKKLKYFTHYFPCYDSLKAASKEAPFDCIIISSYMLQVSAPYQLLKSIKKFCHPHTRIFIESYNKKWNTYIPSKKKHCLDTEYVGNSYSLQLIRDFLQLSDFESIAEYTTLIIPWNIPFISKFFNTILPLFPFCKKIGRAHCTVARLKRNNNMTVKEIPVSIIIPCRNERGNIENILKQTPLVSFSTELIFVEGGSTDGTLEEIQLMQFIYPEKMIKVIQQTGKGKANAVEQAIHYAEGDVIIILDADLTISPADIIPLYHMLINNYGNFINGSRFIYPFKKAAMPFLNKIGNIFFARLVSSIIEQHISDSLCGTKVFYKRDYDRIKTFVRPLLFKKSNDPFGDFDLLFGAACLHLKIINTPLYYYPRTYGKSNIKRFSSGFRLLRICWHVWKQRRLFS